MKSIFIIGCPRSGTTLLQSLVAACDDVITFKESHFYDKGFGIGITGWIKTKQFNEVIRQFLYKNGLSAEYLNSFTGKRNCYQSSRQFLEILDRAALAARKTAWVEKTPDHLFHIPIIKKTRPEAKFLHIVRLPEQTVKSLFTASRLWGKPRSKAAFKIKWLITSIITLAYLPKKNHKVVFYEDIVEETEKVMTEVCKWLEINPRKDYIESYQSEAVSIINHDEIWKSKNLMPISGTENIAYNSSGITLLNRLYNIIRRINRYYH